MSQVTEAEEVVQEEPIKRNVKVLATPAVRRIAQEYGVDLGDIRGSGKEGRVLKEDILAHVEGSSPTPAPAFVPPVVARPTAPALDQVVQFKKCLLGWGKDEYQVRRKHTFLLIDDRINNPPGGCSCRQSGEDQCNCESNDQNHGRGSQDSPLWLQR